MSVIKEAFGGLSAWKKAIVIGTPLAIVGGLAYSNYRKTKKYTDIENEVNISREGDIELTADLIDSAAENIVNHLDLKAAGNKNFRNAKYIRAIECYTEAIRICPDNQDKDLANCYQNRAAAYEQLGDYANVLEDCNMAIAADKQYLKAYRRRAGAYESMERYIDALNDRTIQCVLEDYKIPETMEKANNVLKLASVEKAKVMYKNKKPTMPSKLFIRNYLGSYYNDPIIPQEVIGAEGDISIQSEKINEAIMGDNFDDILDLVNDELSTLEDKDLTLKRQYLLLIRATFLMLIGDFTKCHDAFAAIIDDINVDPKYSSNALIKRASIHLLQDSREKAFNDINKAIEINPDNEDTYYHRAQLYLIMDKMDEANLDYAKVCEMAPEFAIAQAQRCFALSRSAFEKKDFSLLEKSNEEFVKIVEKFSSVTIIHSLYAQSLMDQQKFQTAMDEFKTALSLDPKDVGTICQTALLIIQWKRDEDLAIKMLKEAVPLDPRSKMALELLGTIAVQNGRTGEALTYFRQALEICSREDDLAQIYSLILATEAQAKTSSIKK